MSYDNTIAVLTGDLVGSVALGPEKVEQAMTALEDAARGMEHWVGAPLRFTRHRGDGWQVVVETPKFAIRVALMFRAALRSLGSEFDTYVGLAEGPSHPIEETDLNKVTGDVFTKSGASLEEAKASGPSLRMDYHFPFSKNSVLILADHISQGWTPVQAQLLQVLLAPSDKLTPVTQLAEMFGKSRQTISKSVEAAGFEAIYMALFSLEWEPKND